MFFLKASRYYSTFEWMRVLQVVLPNNTRGVANLFISFLKLFVEGEISDGCHCIILSK